jgi:hypothetical protein
MSVVVLNSGRISVAKETAGNGGIEFPFLVQITEYEPINL